jgi:hypothetical protein
MKNSFRDDIITIPPDVLAEMAKLAKIEDPNHRITFELFLPLLVTILCRHYSGFQETKSKKVTGHKADKRAAAEIRKTAAKLHQDLTEISPHLRGLFGSLVLGVAGTNLEELAQGVAVLTDMASTAYNIISLHNKQRRRGLRNHFLREVYTLVEQCDGRLTFSGSTDHSGSLPPFWELLQPYVPEEVAKLDVQTVWKEMRKGVKTNAKNFVN